MIKLKELRIEKNKNMRQTAITLDIPYITYVSYEKGEREPNSEALIKFADYYNCSVDYLIGRTDERINDSVLDKALEIDNDILEKYGNLDEVSQIEPVKYNLNGIDALAVLEHGLEDWLGIKGKGEPTAEAELVSIGAYPEYAELTFKHNDNTYAFVFRKENK